MINQYTLSFESKVRRTFISKCINCIKCLFSKLSSTGKGGKYGMGRKRKGPKDSFKDTDCGIVFN